MSLDAVSEKIAHFIGAFEMLVEQNRMRLDYDEFRAAKAAEEEQRILDLDSSGVKHSYVLKDYEGELGYKVLPAPMHRVDLIPSAEYEGPEHAVNSTPEETAITLPPVGVGWTVFQDVTETPATAPTPDTASQSVTLNLSVASSVATVTIQRNTLTDDDTFGNVDAVAMQSVPALQEALHTMVDAASALAPLPAHFNPTDVDWIVEVPTIVETAKALADIAAPTLAVSVVTGADAANTLLVNGAVAEEMPSFEDLLPRYVKDKTAAEEAAAEVAAQAHNFGRDFTQDNGTSLADDGSQVVAGANTLVNTATVTSVWLDAPVIVAAGNVVRFDGISQINVLVEHDAVSPELLQATAGDNASTVQNVAAIGTKSSHGDAATAAPTTAIPQFPQNWVVAHVNAPVTQINWVLQNNFTTDFDQAVVTQSGTNLFLGLGENNLGNVFDAFELGFQYDLIIVNGDVIDINLITQTNILLDSDIVSTSSTPAAQPVAVEAPAVTEPDVPASPQDAVDTVVTTTQEAVTVETAATEILATSDDSGSTGNTVAHATATTTSDVDTTGIAAPSIGSDETQTSSQTSGPAPAPHITAADPPPTTPNAPATTADTTPLNLGVATEGNASASDGVMGIEQPQPPAEDAADSEPAPNADLAPSVSTADNLLFNEAIIQTIGADTDAVITDTFQTAIADLQAGAQNISEEVATDTLFDGIALLRVLYIDGDFTTVNYIDQTNILGDADQVHLLRDDFAAALQAEMVVTTGSNILANVAAIRDSGIDSVVMAQGQTYSDALIYQANLVDNDTPSPGAMISDLANEAVAFLVDDMIGDDLADDIVMATNSHIADMPGASDIMQSMLT